MEGLYFVGILTLECQPDMVILKNIHNRVQHYTHHTCPSRAFDLFSGG